MNDTDRTNGTATHGTGPTPPPPPTPRPPLRRPRQGRILAGVAAGLADHLGVDVTVVRIVIVLGAVLTQGLVVLAYLAAAVFVPASDEAADPQSSVEASPGGRNPSFWIGVGLLVVGALWLLGGPLAPGRLFPGIGPDAVWAVVLIGFGLALWRAGENRTTTGPESPHAPAPRAAASPVPTDRDRHVPTDPSETAMITDEIAPPAPPSSGAAPSPEWNPPPVPERESSILTRVTLGAALVVAGVLWSLRLADVVHVGFGHIMAATLGVIGLGLLVGSVAGRGRWLILVGALLVPIVLGAELLRPFGLADLTRIDPRGPAGEVIERPLTETELETAYELGAGSFELDLRDLEFDGDATTRVQIGVGELTVILPDDVTADVTARVGAGELDLSGRSTGVGLERTETIIVGDGSDQLDLHLQAGLGDVEVRTPDPLP